MENLDVNWLTSNKETRKQNAEILYKHCPKKKIYLYAWEQ